MMCTQVNKRKIKETQATFNNIPSFCFGQWVPVVSRFHQCLCACVCACVWCCVCRSVGALCGCRGGRGWCFCMVFLVACLEAGRARRLAVIMTFIA